MPPDDRIPEEQSTLDGLPRHWSCDRSLEDRIVRELRREGLLRSIAWWRLPVWGRSLAAAAASICVVVTVFATGYHIGARRSAGTASSPVVMARGARHEQASNHLASAVEGPRSRPAVVTRSKSSRVVWF
jgi:hypothetical protein